MAYVPTAFITQTGLRLVQSNDLSVITNTLLRKQAYLVLTDYTVQVVIDINLALAFEQNLNLSLPISTVFAGRFTDAFVEGYRNDTIPVLTNGTHYRKGLRVFNPISYKTYKTQFTSMATPTIRDEPTQKGYLDDLVITGPDDLSNTLVAVNGVLHRTTFLNDELFVHDGFRTMRLTSNRDVTLINTVELGGHTVIPLTSSNVALTTYDGQAIVTLPESAIGKTIMLVVDGYLYHLDSNVLMYGDPTHLKIEMSRLPLVSQFRHNPRTIHVKDRYGADASQSSRKYVDEYADLFLDSRYISTATFQTVGFQRSRLLHYHSFLVVFDNPGVYPVETQLIPSGTPRFYTEPSNRVVNGILDYGIGLMPSYLIWKDPFERKSIFINKQDDDLDRQLQSLSPTFVPTLCEETTLAADISARIVDYIVA